MSSNPTRRGVLAGFAAVPILAAPSVVHAFGDALPVEREQTGAMRNISSFTRRKWEDHFEQIGVGAIVCDVASRAVHFWSPQGNYHIFPSSVPKTDELTKRGYTEVVRKKVGPDWRPTASMLETDPDLPRYVGPGPDNPLGTHAMYLGWPAYLIHGTHDTRKIGRPSSSGCFGLYNEQVASLFPMVEIGTQVRVI
ncbi:L,D-transpeptidase [Tropicimonas sp.]|uniref:L,D-transpeptidase n=1 Tax=Tropicimonas sp. TaxID=2067044 RepID=UPI003A8B96AF